jgi:hypothetical protein
MDGIEREPLSDNELQDIGTLKDEPHSDREFQPTCDNGVVDVKQEELPELITFVSVKQEIVVSAVL